MKKPTPKKKQSHAQSSRRYKAHQNFTRLKLMGKVDSMLKLKKLGKLTPTASPAASNKVNKVTKVKA